MEIDSKPEALDRLERRIIQLKIEREALKKEKDEASQQAPGDAAKRRSPALEKEYADLEEVWKSEKAALQGAAQISEELEPARLELEAARRAGRSRRAWRELQYGKIPGAGEAARARRRRPRTRRRTLVRNKVTEEEIAEVVSKWTGIPVSKMLEGEREKLLQHGRRAAQARRRPGRGGAHRLRCDPPLARRACRIRAGRTARSCSSAPPASARPSCARRSPSSCSTPRRRWSASTCREFMEKHSVARLIGAPPGYVGYEEGGYLTEAVRRRPYSVILLDEVEKAHPDVFNVLLQVLDDGRLTDGQGRTVDFRNTVIIMTSNLGRR